MNRSEVKAALEILAAAHGFDLVPRLTAQQARELAIAERTAETRDEPLTDLEKFRALRVLRVIKPSPKLTAEQYQQMIEFEQKAWDSRDDGGRKCVIYDPSGLVDGVFYPGPDDRDPVGQVLR